ncbi:MAG: hypothetical protein R3C11_12110 [Planctomycetaceae bacterium]
MPDGLSLLQKTLLSDYLAYVHGQLGQLISSARQQLPETGEQTLEAARENPPEMRMGWSNWQQLIQLEIQLARQLKKLADPED